MKDIQCKNCTQLKAAWCDKKIDSPDPELVHDCRDFKQITEHDHICGMSDEEMALWLSNIIRSCWDCFIRHTCNNKNACADNFLEWLRSERVK